MEDQNNDVQLPIPVFGNGLDNLDSWAQRTEKPREETPAVVTAVLPNAPAGLPVVQQITRVERWITMLVLAFLCICL